MAKNIFTAVDPAGVTHKRSTARTYTHTVVYKEGRAYADARAAGLERTRVSTEESYTRLENEAKGIHDPKDQWRGPKALKFFTDFAIDYLKEHPNREVYVAQQVADARAAHNRYIAGKSWDRYENAGWTSRLDLAQKLAGTLSGRGYEDIQILTAIKK